MFTFGAFLQLPFLAAVNPQSVAVTEAATATDTPSVTAVFAATGVEAASATDTPSANAVFAASRTEAASASDSPSAQGVYAATQSEAATATDTSSALTDTAAGSDVEPASAADTPSALAVFAATGVEAATATETSDATVETTHRPGAGKRIKPLRGPEPAYDVEPRKPYQPIWDRLRAEKIAARNAELARRQALPVPLPPADPNFGHRPIASRGTPPSFAHLAPADPMGIERRLRDAQDLTDIQSVSAAVTDLEDALEVLRAVGLIAA